MKLSKLKGVKGVSILQLVGVMMMVGMLFFATIQSIVRNNARKKVEETMPKTYEYIEFNRSPSLV